MQLVSIDLSKLDKSLFVSGRNNATYVDLVVVPIPPDRRKFGEVAIVKQSRPKNNRDREMPILGNMKPLSALGKGRGGGGNRNGDGGNYANQNSGGGGYQNQDDGWGGDSGNSNGGGFGF